MEQTGLPQNAGTPGDTLGAEPAPVKEAFTPEVFLIFTSTLGSDWPFRSMCPAGHLYWLGDSRLRPSQGETHGGMGPSIKQLCLGGTRAGHIS